MSKASLFQRLKDRKLVQWALAYLAGAWVLLESAGHVGDQFGWPGIVNQILIVLAGFGFLVVLVIAWYHGEKGRQWVSGPELLIIALLLLLSGGVLSMLRSPGDASDPRTPTATSEAGSPASQGADDNPRLAVLPFENISPNPDDTYYADGVHVEVTTTLSKISGLDVISRTSVMQYGEDRPSIPEIARELNVDFVLDGSVRKDEDLIRLTVQLIDAESDEYLWAEQFDRDVSVANRLSIQGEVARQVASELAVELLPADEARIDRQAPTESLSAYEFYLLARTLEVASYPGGWETLQQAIEYHRRAVQADSGFALAWAGLANGYLAAHYFGPGERAELEELNRLGEEAAQKAVSLDSLSAEARQAIASVLYHVDHDWEGAERELRRAIQLDPGCYGAQGMLDDLLRITGRYDEAVEASTKALAIDPSNAAARSNLASSLWGAGRLEEAAEVFGEVAVASTHLEFVVRMLADVPEGLVAAHPAWFTEIFVFQDMGLSYEEAFQELMGNLARAGAGADQLGAYRERWEGFTWQSLWETAADPSQAGSRPGDRARALTRLGRHEEAVKELRHAWEQGEAGLIWNHENPFFRDLEGFGPYEELMAGLGIPTGNRSGSGRPSVLP
jgi:TolB-like protein